MKKTELQSLINECIAEVLAENRKVTVINEIKRIIAENEMPEEELNEIFGLFKKKENPEGKTRLEKQYDEMAAKATKKASKVDALARAEKEDNYEGDFSVSKGILVYNSKGKGLQGKTGGPAK